jgi:WD40 repeat protein
LNTLVGFHKRGISQLAFSIAGHKLASIGMDDDHSIAIYDWQNSKLVASGKGDKQKLLDCGFVPGKTGSSSELVVVGNKVIKFFTINGRGLKARRGIIGSGKGGKIQRLGFPVQPHRRHDGRQPVLVRQQPTTVPGGGRAQWPGDGEVFVQRRFDHGGARTGK